MTGVEEKMHGKLEYMVYHYPEKCTHLVKKKTNYILKALTFAKSLNLLGLELKNESLLKAERCM